MFERLLRQAQVIASSGAHAERLRAPDDLILRLRPRLWEFGITRLCESTMLDLVGWPVWAAVRPNAPTLSVCQGKGRSNVAAQASAVMEAIEIAAAERVTATCVASGSALVAEGAYVEYLPDLIRQGHQTPDAGDAIGWLRGHDLQRGRDVWVPAEAVQIDSTVPHRRYWQSSDGLGSGSLMIEAVLHGLCEQIERDAGEMWFLRSDDEIATACVDPRALGDEEVSTMDAAVRAAGLHLRLFDATSDIGVPVYFATVSPRPGDGEASWTHFDLASGMGCNLDRGKAAAAAIGEALQSRLTTISAARDDYQPDTYRQQIASDLLVYPRSCPRAPGVEPKPDGIPIERALQVLLARLATAGVDRVIVVPLIDEDDIASAKVLVPGLEHPPGARALTSGPRLQQAEAMRAAA